MPLSTATRPTSPVHPCPSPRDDHTDCEAARLSRDDLEEALKDYPDAQAVIRRASVKLALNRAMVIISLHVQMRRLRANQSRANLTTPAISPRMESEDKKSGPSPPPLTTAKALPPPPPVPVTTTAVAARKEGTPTSSNRDASSFKARSVGIDKELKELQSLLGTEWKEVEYDETGRPIEMIAPSKSGLGAAADETIGKIVRASPKEQAALLAHLMLSTQAKVDELSQVVSSAAAAGGGLAFSRAGAASTSGLSA